MVDRIGDEKAVAILEGTGTYSYFWKEQLQRKGIFVLVADQGMVKSTRRSLGSTDNKDDEFDARSDVRAVPSVLLRNLRSSVLGQGIKPESTRNQPYIARHQNNHPQANQLYKYRQGTAGMGISGTCHSSKSAAQWVFTNWTATCFLGLASQGCVDFLALRIQSRFNNHDRKECELGRAQITELTRQFAVVICDLHDVESGLEVRPIELLGDNMFYRYHARVRSICLRL